MSASRTPDDAALAALAPLLVQALGGLEGGASPAETWTAAKTRLREGVRKDPIDANLGFVLGASALFFLAEKDANPMVRTFLDALVYTTSCMSVGYADVVARTEAGKLVGSIVMTVGPSLAGSLLDPPAGEPDPNAQIQAAILARLDDILAELKRTRAEAP